jgi:transcriptional regulator with XRE-family HTH domain
METTDIGSFVAARLKALRLDRGLSLRQLAKRSDLWPEMLSRAERCERTPSLETLSRACHGLGVSLSDFFSGASTAPPRQLEDGEPDPVTALTGAIHVLLTVHRSLMDAEALVGAEPRRRRGPAATKP